MIRIIFKQLIDVLALNNNYKKKQLWKLDKNLII